MIIPAHLRIHFLDSTPEAIDAVIQSAVVRIEVNGCGAREIHLRKLGRKENSVQDDCQLAVKEGDALTVEIIPAGSPGLTMSCELAIDGQLILWKPAFDGQLFVWLERRRYGGDPE